MTTVRAQLDATAFEAARSRGRALALEDAVAADLAAHPFRT